MKNNIKIAALFAALIGVLIWTSCNKSTNPTPTNQDHGVSQFRDDPPDPPTDPNCIQFHDGCQAEFVEHISKTIQIYSLPVCNADVEYDVWRCVAGSIVHYYFNNFTAYPNENQCSSVLLHWAELIVTNKWDQLQQEQHQFLYDAQQEAEKDYFSHKALPDCDDSETILYSDFYVNTCYKLYWKLIEVNGVSKVILKRVKCGSGCCQRESNWCKSIITGEPVQTILGTSKVGVCQGVLDPVPPGFHPVPPPYDKCERDCKFYHP